MGAFFVSNTPTITRQQWRVIFIWRSLIHTKNKRHKCANLTRFYVW